MYFLCSVFYFNRNMLVGSSSHHCSVTFYVFLLPFFMFRLAISWKLIFFSSKQKAICNICLWFISFVIGASNCNDFFCYWKWNIPCESKHLERTFRKNERFLIEHHITIITTTTTTTTTAIKSRSRVKTSFDRTSKIFCCASPFFHDKFD